MWRGTGSPRDFKYHDFEYKERQQAARVNALISGWKMMSARRALALLVLVAIAAAIPAEGQRARRTRRESNQNRRNRIQRTIDETYSHRWEAAGGGGYLRFRSGSNLQRNNEVTFFGSTMYSLNPKLGVVGEVTGGYGSAKVGNNPFIQFNPPISNYEFMAGPSYRFRMKEKYSVSGFVLGGVGLGKFDGASKGFTSADFQGAGVGLWSSGLAGAFSAGLNVDYNLYPNLSLRVTPNYLGTTYGGSFQNNKGVNGGVVYRFGKIK